MSESIQSATDQAPTPTNEQEMMEQAMMMMMIFGPFMDMMEESREGEE
ncbi:MAG: hypothetical protein ACFB11_03880 [Paracoccaceae bacterium]